MFVGMGSEKDAVVSRFDLGWCGILWDGKEGVEIWERVSQD